MSMRKFAQSVREELNKLDKLNTSIFDTFVWGTDLILLENDTKLSTILNNLERYWNELDDYILTMEDTLKEYEKPSMRKEDVLDVVEERY